MANTELNVRLAQGAGQLYRCLLIKTKPPRLGTGEQTMAEYRKKPMVIEAFQLNSRGLIAEDWFWDAVTKGDIITHEFGKYNPNDARCEIKTPEGIMIAKTGDYIIRGIKGEIYPCKSDIFEATYETADTIPAADVVPKAEVVNAIDMVKKWAIFFFDKLPKSNEMELFIEDCEILKNKYTDGKKTEPTIVSIKTNIYDQEERFFPCTVQVLTNTVTGEVSVGWWKGE